MTRTEELLTTLKLITRMQEKLAERRLPADWEDFERPWEFHDIADVRLQESIQCGK